MNKIKNARFMRSVETDGKVVAEVEFSMELSDQPAESANMGTEQKFVAVLENDGGSTYNLRQVYKNDSTMAIDWYDNAEHQAYVDVTNSMFGDSQLNMDRESFVLDVLDCEGVRVDMESGR
ncbi:MAG: hypothetical protein WD424_06095 [Paenibacillaceae bacterium]